MQLFGLNHVVVVCFLFPRKIEKSKPGDWFIEVYIFSEGIVNGTEKIGITNVILLILVKYCASNLLIANS